MRPALLVLGWGNIGRGDDALGPMCVDMLRRELPSEWRDHVELLEDHQLQIEHVLDLADRRRVLLIDASRDGVAPFQVSYPAAQRDGSHTSHALTPAALLHIYSELYGPPPALTLLAIKGQSFELGDQLSALAQAHLTAACSWAVNWCQSSVVETINPP